VKNRTSAEISHKLSELAGHVAVFAEGGRNPDGLSRWSKPRPYFVWLLGTKIIDEAQVRQVILRMREGVAIQSHVIEDANTRSRKGARVAPGTPLGRQIGGKKCDA